MPCSREGLLLGGLLLGVGDACSGGVCSRGEEVPALWGGSAPGGMPALGGSLLRGGKHGDPAKVDSYCCRRYASSWNAFLFFMPMLNNNGTIFTIFFIIYSI